jgi:hypothetical protein
MDTSLGTPHKELFYTDGIKTRIIIINNTLRGYRTYIPKDNPSFYLITGNIFPFCAPVVSTMVRLKAMKKDELVSSGWPLACA